MASITLLRTPEKGAGASILDRIGGAAKDAAKGAGDVIQAVLGNPVVKEYGTAFLNLKLSERAAKLQRDVSRERPETAQGAASGGEGGLPVSASSSVTGAPSAGGLGGLGMPLAVGLGALILVGVIFALRK